MATEYLVLTNRNRRCRRCREWTLWAIESEIRSDRGLCLDHAGAYPCRDQPMSERAALRNLTAAFPQMQVGKRPQMAAEPLKQVAGTWVVRGTTWARPVPKPKNVHSGGSDEQATN